MNKTREQKRVEYERKRRKKFLYLKRTGQLENYYKQKREKDKPKPKPEPKVVPKPKQTKETMWQKIKKTFKKP